MADVTSKVAAIRSAVYGKDVRENIASGIEVINTESSLTKTKQNDLEVTFDSLIINAGSSNAEIVEARNGEPTLDNRLDKADSQLAQVTSQLSANAKVSNSEFRSSLTGNKRVVLSHFNGLFNASSAGVTYVQSVQELEVNTPGAASYYITFDATRALATSPYNYIDLIVSADDWNKLTSLTLTIYPDKADTGSYYSYILTRTSAPNILPNNKPNEPQLFRIHKSRFTATGTPLYLGFSANSNFKITLATTGILKVKFYKGIIASEPVAPTIMMHDDGRDSIYNLAFPAMKKRGIVGTFYIITGDIGSVGYCTWDQLREMQDAGWTIANHTSSHINLVSATLDDALSAIEDGAKALSDRGFKGANFLAAPYNALDSTRLPYITHIAKAWRIGDVLGISENRIYKNSNTPQLRARSVSYTDTPAYIFDNDYLYNKTLGYVKCINIHGINNSPVAGDVTMTLADFEVLLDMLIADGAIFSNVEQYAKEYYVNVE